MPYVRTITLLAAGYCLVFLLLDPIVVRVFWPTTLPTNPVMLDTFYVAGLLFFLCLPIAVTGGIIGWVLFLWKKPAELSFDSSSKEASIVDVKSGKQCVVHATRARLMDPSTLSIGRSSFSATYVTFDDPGDLRSIYESINGKPLELSRWAALWARILRREVAS